MIRDLDDIRARLDAIPGPPHQPAGIEEHPVGDDVPPLVLTRCKCGGLYDAGAFGRHMDRYGTDRKERR